MIDGRCTDPYHEGDRNGARQRWSAIRDLIRGDTVLDVGCAHGNGAAYVGEGVGYVGIDANVEGLPFRTLYWPTLGGSPWVQYYETTVQRFLADNSGTVWDTIVALETLEHMADGLEIAQRLKNYAARRIIVSVPNNRTGEGEDRNGHVLQGLTSDDFPGYRIMERRLGDGGPSMLLVWDRGRKRRDGKPDRENLTWQYRYRRGRSR